MLGVGGRQEAAVDESSSGSDDEDDGEGGHDDDSGPSEGSESSGEEKGGYAEGGDRAIPLVSRRGGGGVAAGCTSVSVMQRQRREMLLAATSSPGGVGGGKAVQCLLGPHRAPAAASASPSGDPSGPASVQLAEELVPGREVPEAIANSVCGGGSGGFALAVEDVDGMDARALLELGARVIAALQELHVQVRAAFTCHPPASPPCRNARCCKARPPHACTAAAMLGTCPPCRPSCRRTSTV